MRVKHERKLSAERTFGQKFFRHPSTRERSERKSFFRRVLARGDFFVSDDTRTAATCTRIIPLFVAVRAHCLIFALEVKCVRLMWDTLHSMSLHCGNVSALTYTTPNGVRKGDGGWLRGLFAEQRWKLLPGNRESRKREREREWLTRVVPQTSHSCQLMTGISILCRIPRRDRTIK